MKFFILILLSWVLAMDLQAQVGDVTKGSRSNKERSKSGDSDKDSGGSSDGAVFLFLEIFDVINLIGHAQGVQLQKRFDQPHRVSLEASLHGGFYNQESTYIFLPSVRGNWGLFSTHIRSNRIQDRTGHFQTLDWQVIQLNIVNLPEFTLRTGTGLSYVKDIDDMYNEWTVELEGHLQNRRINPALNFRWSNDYQTDEIPRLEINPSVDFQVFQTGKLKVSVLASYRFQRYLGVEPDTHLPFHFMESGLKLYFY